MASQELMKRLKDVGEWNRNPPRDADLSGAKLRCANLSGANLSYANLSYADLSGAYLSGAYLCYAKLRCADLSGAKLRCADLRCADLRCANLRCANLSGANLSGTNLRYAEVGGVRWPSPGVVLGAFWGDLTRDLTRACMRYDAECHPSPRSFTNWAEGEGGKCPYDESDVDRAINFVEKEECWKPGRAPRAYVLMKRLLEHCCVTTETEE